MIEPLNVDKWSVWQKQVGTKGSRDKEWIFSFSKKKFRLFLFKEPKEKRPNRVDFWSEIIAYKLGQLCGVSVPQTECAKRKNVYGALIEYFLKIEQTETDTRINIIRPEDLSHGSDLIKSNRPGFNVLEGHHNIFYAQEVFEKMNRNDLFQDFLKILIFDALIGNTDRHSENWGIIFNRETKTISGLSPAFDNGDSLCWELGEEKLDGLLEANEVKLATYVKKGKPEIQWSEDGIKSRQVNHFEFVELLVKKWPETKGFIKTHTSFSDNEIKKIVDGISQIKIDDPAFKLSEKRLQLIEKIIRFRRNLLKKYV